MSEKRFVLFGLDNETIKDDVTKECYWVNEYVQRKKLVDLLNEQQAEIERLKKELDNFKPVMFQDMRKGTVILYSKGG